MTQKSLVAAALVIVLALSPSVSECLRAHRDEDDQRHRWLLWSWVTLVVILALVAGEALLGGA